MNASSKMKFVGAVLIAAVMMSSCLLPSLHPIYTEDTREIDDRIIGTWTIDLNSDLQVQYDIQVNQEGDTLINIEDINMVTYRTKNIDTSDQDFEHIKNMFDDLSIDDTHSIWTFERAAQVTYERYINESNNSTISMSIGAPSMAPKGYELSNKIDLPYYLLTYKEVEHGDTTTTRLLTNLTNIGDETYIDFVPFKVKSGLFGNNSISAHSFAKISFYNDQLEIRMFDGEYITDLLHNKRIRLKHEKIGEDDEIILTASTTELRSFIEKYGNDEDLYDDIETFSKL
jgi:hypothetical protein